LAPPPLPPPPSSELLPCTSLFRSRAASHRDLRPRPERRPARIPAPPRCCGDQGGGQRSLRLREGPSAGVIHRRAVMVAAPLALLDRKSTRLNSSHRTNSYAVYCLK